MTPNRPCACDRFLPGRAYVAERDCPKCWMFAHRPGVRKAWGGDPADCTPLAAALRGASAAGRPTYEPAGREAEAGTIRHLLYFVYPAATGGGRVWRWNLDKLRRRMGLFNGRRVVAVAAGPGAEPASAVRKALSGCGVDFLEVDNDPNLREMAAFPALLDSVSAYDGPGHVTFYGHAKGVTSESWSPAVRRWTETMYAGCLDHWPAVRRALVDRPFVGAFKRHGAVWAESGSQWHYSGTFRWHRNADFYSRDWSVIDPHWWGSESHPSLHFHPDEAACLFGEFSGGGLALYAPQTWQDWAGAAVERWREDHLPDRWHPLLLTCVLTSHRKPRFVHQAVQSVRAQTAGRLATDRHGLPASLADAAAFDGCRDDPRILVATTGETPDMRGRVCLQSWAINECFRRGLVRGDLVCYLSDDDLYEPGAFAAWLAATRSNPDQSAWYGPAERREVRDGAEVKVGDLPTVGLAGRGGVGLDCKVDGMQICHRRAATVPWPEDPLAAEVADGAFMGAYGEERRHPSHRGEGGKTPTHGRQHFHPTVPRPPNRLNRAPEDTADGPDDDASRLSDGGLLAGGLGPGQNRPPRRPAAGTGRRPPALVGSPLRAGPLRLVRGFRRFDGS